MLRVDGCLYEDPGPLPGPRCLSALAESSSGTSIMCFVLLLDDIRVYEYSNEDPGPLPGPRYIYVYRGIDAFSNDFVKIIDAEPKMTEG